MAILSEITDLLRRWDVWKRVEEAPDRIDCLEKRVAELEAKLARAPGEACPRCGALEYRVIEAKPHPEADFARMGSRLHVLRCGECGFSDERVAKRRS